VFGDEALVNPQHIDTVVSALLEDSSVNVAILVNPYKKKDSSSDIKAVVNENMDVMYLSRADIPSNARTKDPSMYKAYHILPFRKAFLLKYASWPEGKLEQIEFHEHLRILEKGYRIRAVEVESSAVSVDTPDDLQFVREKMLEDQYYNEYKYDINSVRLIVE
jgi:3-deoxy-manno-octulosonate cytidylyltransferase (CMP-KDO synthetase)